MSRGSSFVSDLIWTICIPPMMASFWLLFGRAWTGLLGTTNRRRVQGWSKPGFWAILAILYVGCFGILIYAHLIRP